MKKNVFTFALALLTAASAWAYDFKAGDLYYNIIDEAAKTVEVTYEYDWDSNNYSSNYSSLSGAVNIPETVSYNSMTYSVTSIGDYAFVYCSKLRQMNIPESVTSIGEGAFQCCFALTAMNVEGSNTTYCSENGILFNKDKTTLVCYPAGKPETVYAIPNSVTSIGNYAFADCSKLTQVNIPESMRSIGNYAFADCSALTQVTIPESVTSIGDYAFYGCSALTQVTIPDNVTSIGEAAFALCSKLTQVAIPDGVTSIEDWTFQSCSALTQVTWNAINCANFIYSTDAPFYDCPVTTFIFGDQVEHIPAYLCYSMDKLTEVTIPDGVTSIGNDAFWNCSALTQVNIPNSVTSIGDYAFWNCSALTQVTIPESVTSIGDYAFYGCSALAEMTVLATVPPTVGVDAFDGVSREIPVYVPAESLEDYWVAAVWEEFYYLQAMPANALQTPSMPESIRMEGGMLHNPQGLPVSIYDMQGRMVYSGTAATVSQPAGVYVVLCAGASRKVLF